MTIQQKIATVFGGTGFIGRQVVRGLVRQGYTVKVASRAPECAFFLRTAGMVGQVVPFACDYKDASSLAEAVRGASVVVNCIGILFERRRGDFKRVHTDLPGNIGAACTQANVQRLIHISIPGLDKDRSRYAVTKKDGEEAIRAAFPAVTILRPSVVFGPDDNFFNKFAGLTRLLPVLPLIGGGHTKFQPVYVGDVAEAVIVSAQAPGAAGRVFELAGPETVTFREIYEILFRHTGRRRPFVTLPWKLASLKAWFLEFMPSPLLTRDQVESLKTDYTISEDALTLADLGITATSMDIVLPTYLERYRPGGRFAAQKAA